MNQITDISSTGFRSALDSLHCSSVILDREGQALYHNRSADELLTRCGLSLEEFIQSLNQQINLTYGNGRFSFSAKGTGFVCNVYPWNVDGERMGSTLILHEEMHPNCSVMELHLKENMLREINTMLEASYDGIIVTNQEGNIVRVNTAAEDVLGVGRRDMLGRNVADLIQEQVYDQSAVIKVLETKGPATVITTSKVGKRLLVTGKPVLDEMGALTSVIANLRDFSELDELRRKLEQQHLVTEAYQRELTRLTRQLPSGVIAYSREMIQIFETVESIAQVDSTVLVTGESGVGKEVVVNRICSISNRSQKPFIKINCGAIPAALFESELFGYEEGAFTGARKKGKAGFFEMANGGTLFLDEIGELNLDLQVKLLRVIQEGELTRIGGTHSIKVDVRIIAATNRDLWDLAQKGKFCQDLYYRLNVISLEIPPITKTTR